MKLPSAVVLAFVFVAACGAPESAPSADLETLVDEARQLDLDGRHEDAVRLYQRVLAQDADHFDAHYGLGRALDLAGRYEEARDHFARALQLAPEGDRDQTMRMMGIAWTFAGDVEQAAPCFREVFDGRIAQANYAGAADVANELGRVYLEAGRIDEAETWYRTGHETAQRLEDRPDWLVDLHDMRWAHAQARIAARRGQEDEARRQIGVVRAILDRGGNEDQEVQFPYLVGYVEFHLGNPAAAIAALEGADQEDPFILLLLAGAHEQLGETDAARTFYEAVLRSTSHAVNSAFSRPIARAWLVRQ